METITCKVVICGDYAVGKTTLVKLFLGEKFQNSYKPTIGVDIGRKIVQIDKQKIRYLYRGYFQQFVYFQLTMLMQKIRQRFLF